MVKNSRLFAQRAHSGTAHTQGTVRPQSDACHRSQAPNFCTLQLSLAHQKLLIFSLMQLKKTL